MGIYASVPGISIIEEASSTTESVHICIHKIPVKKFCIRFEPSFIIENLLIKP